MNPTKREPIENIIHNILNWYGQPRGQLQRPYQIDWEASILADVLIAVRDLNRPVFDQAVDIIRRVKYGVLSVPVQQYEEKKSETINEAKNRDSTGVPTQERPAGHGKTV